jgi:hypothetical protein
VEAEENKIKSRKIHHSSNFKLIVGTKSQVTVIYMHGEEKKKERSNVLD